MVDARALRVVYFGTPAFAVPTLEAVIASRHPVVAVVSQPDKPQGRGHRVVPTPIRRVAEAHGLPVLQPSRLKAPEFMEALAERTPDIGVVAAYGRILPEPLLALPPLGMINVHASLLPKYRGAAPIHRAVINGEAETGITIMRVVKELDAGGMLDVARTPIGPDETSVELEGRLAVLGAERLVAVLDRIAAGDAAETPQDDALATYAPKITREDGRIDWTRSASALHAQVRGVQPWPLVGVLLGGTRCLLHRTAVDGADPGEWSPGQITAAGRDGIRVATGDGTLRLLTLQPEGKRIMSAQEFLAGRPLSPGTVVEPA